MESVKYGTYLRAFILVVLILAVSVSMFATDNTGSEEVIAGSEEVIAGSEEVSAGSEENGKRSIDWFTLLVMIGYLGGTLLILPIVIYTNLNEVIKTPITESSGTQPFGDMSVEERNHRSSLVIKKIESKLDRFVDDEGDERVMINRGYQARFIKKALDYINTRLCPTDEEIIESVQAHSDHYLVRTKRVFAGSKLIIFCSAALGILIAWGGLWGYFAFHVLGLILYFLASKIPTYGIERAAKRFSGGGFFGGVFAGLFASAATKHYVKYGDGPWERDGSSELTNSLGMYAFMVIIALLIGLFTALLGVINFLFNYSTSFLTPFAKADDAWFEKNIANEIEHAA